MNLTSAGVSSGAVGKVIQEVSKLVGKSVDRVPSRQTVDRISVQKVAVVQKQLESLVGESDMTLYTDETSKFGKSYGVFAVTDTAKNTYLLGLREMASKSAKTTLDTFHEILEDINDVCSLREEKNDQNNKGYKILSGIKNTMSDKASTEKKFNELLEEYRLNILPNVIEGWADMTEDEHRSVSRMNNFFCELHLLVGAADTCAETLRKFETCSFKGEKVGAQSENSDEIVPQEAGVIRLIRTCSKAFGRGVDEKSGCFLDFQTYCSQHQVPTLFVRYRHNRFNIFFLLAQYVYFHRERIVDFLKEKHGATNRLLSTILCDVQVPLFIAGCRVLGLISKLITAPLWRLIEQDSHILDMNMHYLELYTFLSEQSKDASDFMKGSSPFPDMVEHDSILHDLIRIKDSEDCVQAESIAQTLFTSLKGLLKRQLKDQLPGGKYANASDNVKKESLSTLKHNKLPEFLFGQLDYIVRCRPNASILANEALILYSFNKTSNWLNGLSETERDTVLKDSMEQRRVLYEKFSERKKEIQQIQKKKIEEKERILKEKEQRALERKEKLTSEICYYRLWQSLEDIDKFLSEISTEKEKKTALKAQLNFRKKVLKQHSPEKDIYLFSYELDGKTKQCSAQQLAGKLKTLVLASPS